MRHVFWKDIICVATSGMLCLLLLRPAGALSNAQLFFDTVRANFSSWDINQDGRLSQDEIESNMQNPDFTKNSAAALAALKLSANQIFHDTHEPASYTLADIDALQRKLDEEHVLKPHYIAYFTQALAKIEKESHQLFSDNSPQLTAIRQDETGDCYFLAGVGSLVQSHPKSLVNMIQPNQDGSFTVRFPGKPRLRVQAPTDAEIGAYSDAGSDGIWLNVLEKAYGIYKSGHLEAVEPMDEVALGGGSAGRTIELLTGHKITRIHFHKPGHGGVSLHDEVAGALKQAVENQRMITTGKMHHAYAVIGYDPGSDTVTIWNPHDRDGFEKWPDGTQGPKMDHGVFSIVLDVFLHNFSSIALED